MDKPENDWAKNAFERDFGEEPKSQSPAGAEAKAAEEDSDELLQKAEAAAAAAEKKMAKPRTGEKLLGVDIKDYTDDELKQ